MAISNTEAGFTPELRLFALVNDSYEFNRAVNLIGALVAGADPNNRVEEFQLVDEFGFAIERGELRQCRPWTRGEIIRVGVHRGRSGARSRAISFDDPQRRAPRQKVMIQEVGDSEWKSCVLGSMNNKTICTDLGLQAAVNKSVEHLLREMASELVTCDSFQG